ncbi:MAG: fibronectin type III domain-containing protein [Patescibacteria group bacterium]|jgi:hypothetical protein
MKLIKFYILPLILLAVFFGFKHPAKAEVTYDLKAESLSVSPDSPDINTAVVVTAKIKNVGSDFPLNFSLVYTYSFSNFIVKGSNIISPAKGTIIKTNDYITVELRGSFNKIGRSSLSFKVDPRGYSVETVTANNSISSTIDIAGYDLAVGSITILPANPIINQDCNIYVKVKNNSSYNLYSGNGLDILKNFSDFFITSSSSTSPSLTHPVNSGGYIYYGYEGKFLTNGEKQLSFTVDPDDYLRQSNLANNTLTKKINVYLPSETDLIINSIVFSQPKLIVDTFVDIIIGIKNIGKTSLIESKGFSKSEFVYNFSPLYGINDLTPDDYPTLFTPFNPGDIFHYKLRGYLNKFGNYDINFSFNNNKQIFESNYDNNATSTAVTIYKSLDEANNFSFANQKVNFASSTSAIVSWNTSTLATGKVYYGLESDHAYADKVEVTASSTNFNVTINGLTPGKNYVYKIVSKNNSLEKQDTARSFSMPLNNELKIISGPAVSSINKITTFSWTTNLTSSSKIYYKKQSASSMGSAGTETAVIDHAVEVKNLEIGLYDYFLSSTSTVKTNAKTGWTVFEIKDAAASAPANSAAAVAADNSSVVASAVSLAVNDDKPYGQLKGKIMLKVQSKGEAYYVSYKEKKLYYLGRPADAFQVIRNQGVGISNANLAKIPVSLSALSGADADKDGLPDALETAIGTDKNKTDSDGDGFNDKDELMTGYAPWAKNIKINYDNNFSVAQKGKIFLQVESRGEAWYVNPADGKRYFLARPADAFSIMRQLGVGLSNSNFDKLAK